MEGCRAYSRAALINTFAPKCGTSLGGEGRGGLIRGQRFFE